jgi:small subunit ribosomal protein S16
MVKIRLSRIGTKGRPFYRVVVTEASTPRGGKVVETLGTYDPTVKPTLIQVDEEKALEWMLKGAKPSETAAIILNRAGVLPRFLEQRPNQKKNYAFLDKRTAAISVSSSVEAPAIEGA